MSAGGPRDVPTGNAGSPLKDARKLEMGAALWAVVALAMWTWWFVDFEPFDSVSRWDEEPQGKGSFGILALTLVLTTVTTATFVYSRVMFRLAHLERGRASGTE